jgi:ABC-type transporter Mla MlaB component
MLKISVQDGVERVTLKLEGRLAGTWVAELEDCWRTTRSALAGRSLCVHLMAVEHVDTAGIYLLALLHLSGAQLVASGTMMSEVVRSITVDWPLIEKR